MIIGRFGNTSDRPYIEAFVSIPSLGKSGGVSFCMDTGADGSVLMPTDAIALGIDHSALDYLHQSIGVGGISEDAKLQAEIMFSHAGKGLYVYKRVINIPMKKDHLVKAPSLLGRDIIKHWKVVMDYTNLHLTAEVRHCTLFQPFS